MQPLPGPPRRRDDRKAWLPFAIIAAIIVLLFLSLIIVFRRDDEVERAAGTLPESFDSLTIASSTTTTTSTVPPPTPPPAIVATTRPGGRGTDRDGPPGESTSVPADNSPAQALARMAEQSAATVTSAIVPIGSDLYAMMVVHGRGQLLRWTSQREWVVADRLDPPGSIRDIKTADVTGDAVQDFVIFMSGVGQPGGVYSRATFTFGLLPFNTLQGKKELIDGLDLRLGTLTSPFRDASGSRTLTWTWTGDMFEAR